VPPTPDGGALCYALRTGFSSSQGELVRMIEFSTQSVSGDSREILCALAILFVFALVSAGYVLKKGLEKGATTTHALLLKCVIIITSVVPRSLPTQMAMAVNTALMSLTKAGIFCTEPFRLPNAGKITHCLFDKTGTLTTDQLVPVGVVNHGLSSSSGTGAGGKKVSIDPATGAAAYVPVSEASREAGYVLGACHALVHVDGAGLVGDPIEVAALRGVEWSYDHATSTCSSGNLEAETKVRGGGGCGWWLVVVVVVVVVVCFCSF
jgi:cation-transporting ATPase 13A1